LGEIMSAFKISESAINNIRETDNVFVELGIYSWK